MTDINHTLAQRGVIYGDFARQSYLSEQLKNVMHLPVSWRTILWHDQREALDMIAVKIARILNGDPNYADSWHDIAGYATLIAKRLEEK